MSIFDCEAGDCVSAIPIRGPGGAIKGVYKEYDILGVNYIETDDNKNKYYTHCLYETRDYLVYRDHQVPTVHDMHYINHLDKLPVFLDLMSVDEVIILLGKYPKMVSNALSELPDLQDSRLKRACLVGLGYSTTRGPALELIDHGLRFGADGWTQDKVELFAGQSYSNYNCSDYDHNEASRDYHGVIMADYYKRSDCYYAESDSNYYDSNYYDSDYAGEMLVIPA